MGVSTVTARIEHYVLQTTLSDKLKGMVLNTKKPEGDYHFEYDPLNPRIAWLEMYFCPYHQHVMLKLAKSGQGRTKKRKIPGN